jgi:diguanylate cyclase (GGDEF)-like protein
MRLLARLGLADDADWQALVLYVARLIDHSRLYTPEQRDAVRAMVLGELSSERFSPRRFKRLVAALEKPVRDNCLSEMHEVVTNLERERRFADLLVREVEGTVLDLRRSFANHEERLSRFGEETEDALGACGERAAVVRRVKELLSGLLHELADEAQAWQARARELSRHVSFDPLIASLHNRRALDAHLAEAAPRALASGQELSFILLDIDHFKRVNDTYGHPVGDAVLQALGDILAREMAGRSGLAARYGGEELALVMEEVGAEKALALAERLRSLMAACVFTPGPEAGGPGKPFTITVSLGVAALSPGAGAADLIREADAALYSAKRAGRNRAVLFGQQQGGQP